MKLFKPEVASQVISGALILIITAVFSLSKTTQVGGYVCLLQKSVYLITTPVLWVSTAASSVWADRKAASPKEPKTSEKLAIQANVKKAEFASTVLVKSHVTIQTPCPAQTQIKSAQLNSDSLTEPHLASEFVVQIPATQQLLRRIA